MDFATVTAYLKDLFATFTVFFAMLSPFSGGNGTVYEAAKPDELITSFVVVSDIHVETNQPQAYNYLHQALEGIKAGKNVDAVIYTGDNVMNGQTLENFFFYSAVRAVKPAENNLVLAGNHDLGNTEGDFETLLNNYIRNNRLYLGEDVGKGYFCRVINGCYFISLISEDLSTWDFTMGEEQFNWLEGVLKEAEAADAPIFVFNHYPLHYNSDTGSRLAALLSEYGADLFVHGHYHDHSIKAGNFYTWGGINSVNLTRPTEMTLFEPGEGIVVEVYENEFTVRVRNFITGEWVEGLAYTYSF